MEQYCRRVNGPLEYIIIVIMSTFYCPVVLTYTHYASMQLVRRMSRTQPQSPAWQARRRRDCRLVTAPSHLGQKYNYYHGNITWVMVDGRGLLRRPNGICTTNESFPCRVGRPTDADHFIQYLYHIAEDKTYYLIYIYIYMYISLFNNIRFLVRTLVL